MGFWTISFETDYDVAMIIYAFLVIAQKKKNMFSSISIIDEVNVKKKRMWSHILL